MSLVHSVGNKACSKLCRVYLKLDYSVCINKSIFPLPNGNGIVSKVAGSIIH